MTAQQRARAVERAREWHLRNPERAKELNRAKAKRYQARHPERSAASKKKHLLKKTYGMTTAEFAAMFEGQEGLCAICSRHLCLKCDARICPTRACVDHVHDEGRRVRGMLCAACNAGIGMFKDSGVVLRSAIGYLASI